MQFLILFFKGFFIGYLVIWIILLLLCLRRRQFCPVIGDSAATRYFWLATFIFFNPVLTALYLIFGQIRSPRAKPNRFTMPTVLTIAILGFFVNFPGITHLWMQPFLGRSADANPRFKAHLAAISSANNTTTSISTSSRGNDRLACGQVIFRVSVVPG